MGAAHSESAIGNGVTSTTKFQSTKAVKDFSERGCFCGLSALDPTTVKGLDDHAIKHHVSEALVEAYGRSDLVVWCGRIALWGRPLWPATIAWLGPQGAAQRPGAIPCGVAPRGLGRAILAWRGHVARNDP